MKKIFLTLSTYLIYATFFVPLIVLPNSFIFPFVVPKVLFLRTMVLVVLGLYCLLLAINWKEFRPRLNLAGVSVLAFLVSFILSSFFGVDFYHSLWDNHERMLGLFTIIHYVILYFIAQTIFTSWGQWRKSFLVFLGVGTIVMLLGCYQKIDPNFLLNQGSDRIVSTLGNAIYVGGYALFLFFISLLLFLKERSQGWKIAEALMGLLAILGMVFSGTRGSLLGLLVGLVIIILGYSLLLKNQPKVRIGLGILFSFILLSTGFLYINRSATWVQNLPAVGRLVSTTLNGGGISTRIIAWKIAVESWKEHPVWGWGPNNYFYAFNKYYNPQSLEHSYSETWFDNAHNIILNTLTTQGLTGIIIYLGLFVAGMVSLWKNKFLRSNDYHIIIIMTAFLVAHLIENITVFENPTSYLYFFLALAFIAASARLPMNSSPTITPVLDKKMSFLPIGVVGLVTFVTIYITNILPAQANSKTLLAMSYISQNVEYGLPYVKSALEFNSPHIDDIRSDLSRTMIQTLAGQYTTLNPQVINNALVASKEALEKNLVLHPLDIRIYLYLAQLYQLDFTVNKDAKALVSAERVLEQGLDLSPRRQQFIYALANIKLQLNKGTESVNLVKQSIDDDPKIVEGYWRLAYTYYLLKDLDSAKKTFNLAYERGINFNEDEQGQKIEALIMGEKAVSSTPR